MSKTGQTFLPTEQSKPAQPIEFQPLPQSDVLAQSKALTKGLQKKKRVNPNKGKILVCSKCIREGYSKADAKRCKCKQDFPLWVEDDK